MGRWAEMPAFQAVEKGMNIQAGDEHPSSLLLAARRYLTVYLSSLLFSRRDGKEHADYLWSIYYSYYLPFFASGGLGNYNFYLLEKKKKQVFSSHFLSVASSLGIWRREKLFAPLLEDAWNFGWLWCGANPTDALMSLCKIVGSRALGVRGVC